MSTLEKYGICKGCGRAMIQRPRKAKLCAVCQIPNAPVVDHPKVELFLERMGTFGSGFLCGFICAIAFLYVVWWIAL